MAGRNKARGAACAKSDKIELPDWAVDMFCDDAGDAPDGAITTIDVASICGCNQSTARLKVREGIRTGRLVRAGSKVFVDAIGRRQKIPAYIKA